MKYCFIKSILVSLIFMNNIIFCQVKLNIPDGNLIVKMDDYDNEEFQFTREYNSSSILSGWFGKSWGTFYESELIFIPDGSVIMVYPGSEEKYYHFIPNKWSKEDINLGINNILVYENKYSIGYYHYSDGFTDYIDPMDENWSIMRRSHLLNNADERVMAWLRILKYSNDLKIKPMKNGISYSIHPCKCNNLKEIADGFVVKIDKQNLNNSLYFDDEGKISRIETQSDTINIKKVSTKIIEISNSKGNTIKLSFNNSGFVERIIKNGETQSEYFYDEGVLFASKSENIYDGTLLQYYYTYERSEFFLEKIFSFIKYYDGQAIFEFEVMYDYYAIPNPKVSIYKDYKMNSYHIYKYDFNQEGMLKANKILEYEAYGNLIEDIERLTYDYDALSDIENMQKYKSKDESNDDEGVEDDEKKLIKTYIDSLKVDDYGLNHKYASYEISEDDTEISFYNNSGIITQKSSNSYKIDYHYINDNYYEIAKTSFNHPFTFKLLQYEHNCKKANRIRTYKGTDTLGQKIKDIEYLYDKKCNLTKIIFFKLMDNDIEEKDTLNIIYNNGVIEKLYDTQNVVKFKYNYLNKPVLIELDDIGNVITTYDDFGNILEVTGENTIQVRTIMNNIFSKMINYIKEADIK